MAESRSMPHRAKLAGDAARTVARSTAEGSILRAIPAVGRLLSTNEFQALLEAYSRIEVLRATRRELERLRRASTVSHLSRDDVEMASIHRRVVEALADETRMYHRRVINATGV